MKRKIIVGNWKMNPSSLDEAKKIFSSIKRVSSNLSNTNVVVCPPSLFVSKLTSSKSSLALGVQNIYSEDSGSFTGEISATMAKDIGVRYAILGHSERRDLGESDEFISKKVMTALNYNICPILCVGEKVHDSQGLYLDILRDQIKSCLSKVSKKLISEVIIAYEPVWAIGAKEPMSTSIINEMVIFIKKVVSDIYGHENGINTVVLYGGSVNFRNAADIIRGGGVNGLLVGRDSVNVQGFTELLKAVDQI